MAASGRRVEARSDHGQSRTVPMFRATAPPARGGRFGSAVTWGCGIRRAPSLQQVVQIALGGIEEAAPAADLGPVLHQASRIAGDLVEAQQVYNCLCPMLAVYLCTFTT